MAMFLFARRLWVLCREWLCFWVNVNIFPQSLRCLGNSLIWPAVPFGTSIVLQWFRLHPQWFTSLYQNLNDFYPNKLSLYPLSNFASECINVNGALMLISIVIQETCTSFAEMSDSGWWTAPLCSTPICSPGRHPCFLEVSCQWEKDLLPAGCCETSWLSNMRYDWPAPLLSANPDHTPPPPPPPWTLGRRAMDDLLLHTQTSWRGRRSGDSCVFTPNSINEQSLPCEDDKHLMQRSGIH